jgi:prepilin-type N-terminal cleavage/methylation domain-containing protein
MKNNGITLVELLVVISIIGILVIALGFSFQGWRGNYNIESATKDLYADIMDARAKAMTRSRMYFVQLNADNYSVYEDTDDDTNFNPVAGDNPVPEYRDPATGNVKPKKIEYNLGWTGDIGFDTRGLAWEYIAADTRNEASVEIPLTLPAGLSPDYDCIVVGQMRVQMGKMSEEGSCDVK